MFWTYEQDETLQRLWRDGHSASRIAERMGVTKNAIVGRAHRIGCDLRASPIKRIQVEPFVPPPDSIPRVKAPDYPVWSAEELAVLARYPNATSKWLKCILVSRSYFSIQEKRNRLRAAAKCGLPPKVVQVPKPQTKPIITAPPPRPVAKLVLPSTRSQCQYLHGNCAPYRQCDNPAILLRADGSVCPEGAVWCTAHRAAVYSRTREAAA